MADNNNQNGQDSTQQLINIFKAFNGVLLISSILNYSYIIPNSWILENNFNYCLVFNWNWNRVYERPYTRLYEFLE